VSAPAPPLEDHDRRDDHAPAEHGGSCGPIATHACTHARMHERTHARTHARSCARPANQCYKTRMAILLVRHGETTGNAARVVQRPDALLSERGIQQAARLAERLLAAGFAHVLCSDLVRARMTAEPLRAHRGVVIEETPLLQERNFGDLRGTPYAELTEDPFAPSYVPPNGESVEAFHRRVAQAFELIVERRRRLSGTLVVVTHGLMCRALVENHGRAAAVPEHFGNTGVTELDPEPPFAARLVNCLRHLAEPSDRHAGPV
jgi:2,3-bisphosphoglycerate-dependent phosphoglycerate mutase